MGVWKLRALCQRQPSAVQMIRPMRLHYTFASRERQRIPCRSEDNRLVRTTHVPPRKLSRFSLGGQGGFRPETALEMTSKIEHLLSATLSIIDAKFAIPPPPPSLALPAPRPSESKNVRLLKSALSFDFDDDDFDEPVPAVQHESIPTPTYVKVTPQPTLVPAVHVPLKGELALRMVMTKTWVPWLRKCDQTLVILGRQPNNEAVDIVADRLMRIALEKLYELDQNGKIMWVHVEGWQRVVIYRMLWCIRSSQETEHIVHYLVILLSIPGFKRHPLTDTLLVEVLLRMDSMTWPQMASICRGLERTAEYRVAFADRLIVRINSKHLLMDQLSKNDLTDMCAYLKMCNVYHTLEPSLQKAIHDRISASHWPKSLPSDTNHASLPTEMFSNN